MEKEAYICHVVDLSRYIVIREYNISSTLKEKCLSPSATVCSSHFFIHFRYLVLKSGASIIVFYYSM